MNKYFSHGSIIATDLTIVNTASLGGTVSAEHGIGKLKANCLKEMHSKKNLDQIKSSKDFLAKQTSRTLENRYDSWLLPK